MESEERKIVEYCKLLQPAASYDSMPNKNKDATIPWPPALTVKYQQKFIQNFVLNRAWQEVPSSVLIALVETVRNRILRFALDLKMKLKDEHENAVEKLPPDVIDRSVTNYIYGGNILIASHAEHFSLISQTNVGEGDFAALGEALRKLGITQEGISALRHGIESDKQSGQETIGPKTKQWIGDVGKYLAKESAKAGFEIAKQAATKWILQHFGLSV